MILLLYSPLAYSDELETKGEYFSNVKPIYKSSNDLIELSKKYVGQRNPTHFKGPWCGSFLGMIADQSNYQKPKNYRQAKSWIRAGEIQNKPQIGHFVYSKNHVGIIIDIVPNGIIMLSGNYSNIVAISFHGFNEKMIYIKPKLNISG